MRILSPSHPNTNAGPARKRFKWTPYWFMLPYLVFFLALRLGPSLAGLGISFTNWQVGGTTKFVGLANFRAMPNDARLLDAIKNTVVFTVLTVPLLIALSLALALLLNQRRRGRTFGRVAAFTPYVMMSTVIGILWTWILEKDFGLLNAYLGWKIPWLVDSDVAMYSVVITTVWWTVGYDMVLFLAGLQDIPRQVYEAAQIDGANKFQTFRHVTIPMLAPTIFLVLLLSVTNSFQVFDQVYVMTAGGPGTATLTLVQYIYTVAFQFQKFGYGSAVALLLFVILVGFALLQMRAYRRGVEGVGA
jgi:multiple sugar transport system permease protein